mmetsp:Transcript_86576/g.249987  ORF Transcript_86576/g.249987 Transcript_86576/m.249987 type:complete len:119 (+) Transcript_86576:393-749(+)
MAPAVLSLGKVTAKALTANATKLAAKEMAKQNAGFTRFRTKVDVEEPQRHDIMNIEKRRPIFGWKSKRVTQRNHSETKTNIEASKTETTTPSKATEAPRPRKTDAPPAPVLPPSVDPP